MPNPFKLFKKVETKPLPDFEEMVIQDLPPASALLFYGNPGNKLTQLVGERVYNHPFSPPAFHAAFYIEDGFFLNVGKFKTINDLFHEFRSTRRIDAVIYKNLTPEDTKALCATARKDVTIPKVGFQLPDYAITDYLRFLIKWWKPSKKDFCSEQLSETFATRGIKISDQEHFNCAPWDVMEFALAHPETCKIVTVWKGDSFL